MKGIREFLDCKKIAVAGVSRKKGAFSVTVAEHLESLGYEVARINPNFQKGRDSLNEYSTISELPSDFERVIVLTNSKNSADVVSAITAKGIKQIWIQQKSENSEVMNMLASYDCNLVWGRCIFMFTNPKGIHKFHYSLSKFFGRVPSE